MTRFAQRLDLELERIGWTARDRKWREDAEQFRRDVQAVIAKLSSTREPGGANNAPGTV